ncbi:MAG: OmpA family protein [Bacteroides sp.]|nr:OmpA family protein [Bacteroidales bacterium]MBD5205232.1 OmpA family protein [Bacteroidales bacterium]MBD5224179.1 OmpA family protein [Bacteroidales bacterium]MBD5301983.1 OmpA family protein [Bacteroides sp.]MBD5305139.1 OmpA family protein [Bacteroides sp.]
MKGLKTICAALLCGSMLFGTVSCNMSNTGKGALIGGGGGAGLGAGVGALIGGGKGAGIGAGVGAALGAGVGALIGNHMDKQKKQLEEELAKTATVEETTDTTTGLKAIRVTFEGGILFPTGKYTLNEQAKANLARFADNLKQNPNTDLQILGFTDNTGSFSVNDKLSNERASAVMSFLANQGVSPTRMVAKGIPMADYVASNETAEGRAKNRRVEIFITANEQMIKDAQNGTLK